MQKNFIKFSENGTKFHFVFSNGSESLSFYSKVSGIHAVVDLFKKGKISEEESKDILHKIVNEERLPFYPSISFTILSFENFTDDLSQPIHFKICESGKCGMIIGNGIIEGDFYNKQEAKTCLENLFKKGLVTIQENAMINYQIEKSLSD